MSFGRSGQLSAAVLDFSDRARDPDSPRTEGPMKPTRKKAASGLEQALQGKAAEVRERLTEAGQTVKQHVTEGLQSAASGEKRPLGQPPSGLPPSVAARSRRSKSRAT